MYVSFVQPKFTGQDTLRRSSLFGVVKEAARYERVVLRHTRSYAEHSARLHKRSWHLEVTVFEQRHFGLAGARGDYLPTN
jgi:hypothetical protein